MTTFDAGLLIPIFAEEYLPGDTVNLRTAAFLRLATPIRPIMDNAYIDTQFFAVPYRLIWDNFQKFMGEQIDPGDSTDFLIPQVECPGGGWTADSLADYFGIPTGVGDLDVNALFFRAYNLIYNEWYRDQNLIDSVPVPRDDGPDDAADYTILRRGKRHDYFTSCLPWPQKGDEALLPLGISAPIYGDGNTPRMYTSVDGTRRALTVGIAGETDNMDLDSYGSTGKIGVIFDDDPDHTGLRTDLTEATAATINQLREAFQIQKFLERDARGGTRYIEIIKNHYGVTSPDARLQRPEYLGGGTSPIVIHPIAQTSSTDATTPQGNLAAFGTGSFSGHGFVKSFTEHTLVIGIASVRADLTYQKGLNRKWTRRTKFDHYWPEFSALGEQAVLNQEIFAQGTSTDEEVFGYQERYAEYRYSPSIITGRFRSDYVASLDSWHLSQDFDTLPVLNQAFIEENPPFDRVIAVPEEPHFLADFFFKRREARPMPLHGVPGMIDHF